jgi:hypothetical protein
MGRLTLYPNSQTIFSISTLILSCRLNRCVPNESFLPSSVTKKKCPWGNSWQYDNTDRAALDVGEVSANFCGYRVPSGQRDGSLRQYSRLSRPEPLLFVSSSSSIVLTRLCEPRSRPTISQKIWWRQELDPGSLTTLPKLCAYTTSDPP